MKKGDIVYIIHHDGIWSAFIRTAGPYRVTIQDPKPVRGKCSRYPYGTAFSPHLVYTELRKAEHVLMRWLRHEKENAERTLFAMSDAIATMYNNGYTDPENTVEVEK